MSKGKTRSGMDVLACLTGLNRGLMADLENPFSFASYARERIETLREENKRLRKKIVSGRDKEMRHE